MNNSKWYGWFLLIFPLLFNSCIKDEALNVEADIESVVLDRMDAVNNVTIQEDKNLVTILLKKDKLDVTKDINPSFVLSQGATIQSEVQPQPGKNLDFTNPQKYIVTSQDGKWKRTYLVAVAESAMPTTKYGFEFWRMTGKYESAFERIYKEEGNLDDYKDYDVWSSGNAGFATIAGSKPASAYPTHSTTDARTGSYALEVQTCETGVLGAASGLPIAAGNMFIGTFQTRGINIMKEPLKATRFGVAFEQEPVLFNFWYKYSPKNHNRDGQTVPDSCSVYAVFYENENIDPSDPEIRTLDGTNVLTHPNVVATAEMPKEQCGKVVDVYTYVSLPFIMKPGKHINREKLLASKYSVTIVFASSIKGAEFKGGIGSKLIADDVELICKK